MRLVAALLIGALLLVFGYLLLTPGGGLFLSRVALRRFLGADSAVISRAEGSVLTGLHLEGVEVRRLPEGLPEEFSGARLSIRRLSVRLPPAIGTGVSVAVHSARLQLPESEPVLISGSLDRGRLHFSLYSQALDVLEVLRLFLSPADAVRFAGTARQVDLTVHGSVRRPKVSGGFHLEELRYGTLELKECPVAVALELSFGGKGPSMRGEVLVKEGSLRLRNIAVQLGASRFLYTGDPKKPRLDLNGTSEVEKVQIRISLKGTFRQPQLRLASTPPLPEDHLLLMLATGRRWKGMEKPAGEGGLPLDLVGQFLDYTMLGGSAGNLAQRLGLEASVIVSEEGKSRGAGVRKSITDKIGVRYGVNQDQPDVWGAPPITRQNVGAEVQVTESDQISLEAQRQVDTGSKVGSETVSEETDPPVDSKVFLRYKKKF